MLPPQGDPFYTAVGLYVVTMIRRRFDAGGQPGVSWLPPRWREGGKALLDTGRLQRSINHRVRKSPGGGVEISVGTADVRAAIHHFGGEIRPRNAKALFVPISEKGRRVGPRPKAERDARSAKIFKAAQTSNRRAARMAANELVYGVDFILVGKVTIPARPFLFLAPEQKDEVRRFVVTELRARGYGGN
jgi:phage gpG-like protein